MNLFNLGRKTKTSTVTGFLQSDVQKFLRQGASLSTSNLQLSTPTQRSFTTTTSKGGFGAALMGSLKGAAIGTLAGPAGAAIGSNVGFAQGLMSGDATTETSGTNPALFANISQEQIQELAARFAARSEEIRTRMRMPGRERLFRG